MNQNVFPNEEEKQMLTAADVMTKNDIITVTKETTVRALAELFTKSQGEQLSRRERKQRADRYCHRDGSDRTG